MKCKIVFLQILKEFEQANEKVNASALLDKWSNLSYKLRRILMNHYKVNSFQTEWSADIEDFLVLLKMFPSRQIGRNVVATNASFKKSIEQLVCFEPVICLQSELCIAIH